MHTFQKTYMQKTAEVKRDWHVLDAQGVVLGQLAVDIATKLLGKNKRTYTPHIDAGDYVVVINAKSVVVTSDKQQSKLYFRHSGFPGGLTVKTFSELLDEKPAEVIARAVYNMLPKNRLRRGRMARLKVYAGAEHKHQAQVGSASESTAEKA